MFSLGELLSGPFHQKSKTRAGFVNIYRDLPVFFGLLTRYLCLCGHKNMWLQSHTGWLLLKRRWKQSWVEMVSCQTCAICAFDGGCGSLKVTSRLVFCFTFWAAGGTRLCRKKMHWRKTGSQGQIKWELKMHHFGTIFLFHFWISVFQNNIRFGNRRILTFSVWCWRIKEIKRSVTEHTSYL